MPGMEPMPPLAPAFISVTPSNWVPPGDEFIAWGAPGCAVLMAWLECCLSLSPLFLGLLLGLFFFLSELEVGEALANLLLSGDFFLDLVSEPFAGGLTPALLMMSLRFYCSTFWTSFLRFLSMSTMSFWILASWRLRPEILPLRSSFWVFVSDNSPFRRPT